MGRTECVMYKRMPKVITVYSSKPDSLDDQAGFFSIPHRCRLLVLYHALCNTPCTPYRILLP
jgi:hypothetical protein